MRNPTIFSVLAIAALVAPLALSGCGTKSPGRHSEVAEKTVVTTPLTRSVRILATDGLVEAQLGVNDPEWKRIDPANPKTGVRSLRALGANAMIEIDGHGETPAATLWLRTNTEVAVAQDASGAIVARVVVGAIRLRAAPAAETRAFVQTDAGVVAVGGRDVLVDRVPGSAAVVAFTKDVPKRADWSHSVSRRGLDEGFGTLEGAPTNGQSTALRLRSVNVSVETQSGYAHTAVEHIFHNGSDQLLEGTFRFPVPHGAMVESLAMEIGGVLMEGEIVEKEKAREVYEKIVDNMLDPALLEWEQGNWFKLRVFPIEANADKRVIIRYSSPLKPTLSGYEYRFFAAAAEMQKGIDNVSVTVDGKVVREVVDLAAAEEVVVPIASSEVASVATEVRAENVYVAARIRPDWSTVAAPNKSADERVMILFDTSRSALEARGLAEETLKAVLTELPTQTRFSVVTFDVTTTQLTDGFVAAGQTAIANVLAKVSAQSMDGASDLSAALALAKRSKATSIIYIGDGTPTWGITGEAELLEHARDSANGAPLFAALIGKGASASLWEAMTGQLGGRAEVTNTPLASQSFAFFAARAHTVKRINNLTAASITGVDIYPRVPRTLFEGDELTVLLRAKKDTLPEGLAVSGVHGANVYSQRVELAGARSGSRLAQQWASLHLRARASDGAEKEEIVELSREYGILSRHTSLLVLESEEAYAEHQIDRKRGPKALAANGPQVTGGDLESLNGREATLSPNHIQPGDPEIKVPAPRDAERVVVIFPFGDTKLAVFDDEANAWIARFLIDKDTADGDYFVTVVITHVDGRVERKTLPYTVDTMAPTVNVALRARADGSFMVTARQTRGPRPSLRPRCPPSGGRHARWAIDQPHSSRVGQVRARVETHRASHG